MFAVIYRFKIKPGMEASFQKNWEILTHEFRDVHGGLGSCLHKGEDGILLAYARWPSEEMWKAKKEISNKIALEEMKNCIDESFPAWPLNIVNDLLVK